MSENSQTEIISVLNNEGMSGAYISTFIFLWLIGDNIIKCTQGKLAKKAGLRPRTLRSHLYKLRDAGLIEYSNSTNNNIHLKRFQH